MSYTSLQNGSETGQQISRQFPDDIYRKLAPIYDNIMKDVDYEDWTDYIHSVLLCHHPYAHRILELACGTGTMALTMEQRDDYEITATDGSREMIRIARLKASQSDSEITWKIQDIRRLQLEQTFEAIYMVFDSLNYLHEKDHIRSMFEGVSKHLDENGIFVFDFTTPNYSPKIAPLLNGEENVTREYRYTRMSEYDRDRSIHINHFMVEKKDPSTGVVVDRFEEIHQQRIWTFREVKAMVSRSDLQLVAAYEDFDLNNANNNSDRITMVLTHG